MKSFSFLTKERKRQMFVGTFFELFETFVGTFPLSRLV
jgi:hypothetical protein